MSSLLPVVVPPTRARTEPVEDRRAGDVPRDAFAESLATARGDDTPARTDDLAAAKARQAAQQRAHLQSLMLNGAMKYAVTRQDGAQSAVFTGGALSLPAVPDQAQGGNAMPDGAAPESAVLDTTLLAAPIATPEEHSMQRAPGAGDGAAPTEFIDDAVAPSVVPQDAHAKAKDSRVSGDGLPIDPTAAQAAALQLLASLPPMSLPDAPEGGETVPSDAAAGTARTVVSLDRPIASLPDAPTSDDGAMLVEDHFDVPAAVHADAMPGAGMTGTESAVTLPAGMRTTPTTPTAGAIDASAAAAIATHSATPVVAGHTVRGAIERDTARLDPAFRARLERVMERMRKEFGHDVTVVETVRSQARQDALFAQGRTVPGQVVTWTKQSKHGKGMAADLLVDGEWQNPVGYAHLATVAKEEGLRTLGARDPGHVELPAEGGVSGSTLDALLGDLQGDAGDAARQIHASLHREQRSDSNASAMARVANVAQVARVATVASVAKVATVARPGEGSRGARDASETTSPLAVSGAVPMAGATDLAGSMRVITPASAVNMADRISQLMDLQATQASKPLNSVLLRMENAGGLEDQIRIDTRGTTVDARLGLGNAQQAAALTDRLGELREALERRGLTADGVRVQSTAALRTTDSATFSRATAPIVELAAMRAASDNQAQGNLRDQAARDQQQRESLERDSSRHTPRSSSDDTRHRSRREQPEDRR
ncbi:MAG: M15 family metallopeptidase [Gemmatimonadaceae bacterium]|nr:M15 family metallopeptidase [Gemmatimonadaceae bacterium]